MSTKDALHFALAARVGPLQLDVAMEVGPQTLVLVGPNGAGKTSLIELVLGARVADRGHVQIGNELLFDRETGVDVPLEHRRIGYVPQDYALFPHLSVRGNIEFALGSVANGSSAEVRREQADRLLDELGLRAYAERRPDTLSGGEKQRVALARALSVNPRALLLDEPLAALDVHSRNEVRSFLAEYLAKVERPTIVVTHDAEDARALGGEVAVLEAGRITQRGTFELIERNPATAFAQAFVGAQGRRRKMS